MSKLHTIQSTVRNWRSTWIVLVVGLMITATATLHIKSGVEKIAEHEFIYLCNEIDNKIIERLDNHASILQSGVAFFNASETVTREEWRIFNGAQKVEKQLPGIQGIGFSLLIPRAELARHIQGIRREGFPDYTLKPDGDREVYSSIIYLEPFSDRNLRAFGYDMFSEPVRRAAMERARDTNAAALSDKVVLVQETSTDIQAGVLMYVPVYRKSMPTETVEQRRAAIHGWVYSPYRMNDLMQGTIGDLNTEKEKQLYLQVFDGEQPSPSSLLYQSFPEENQKSGEQISNLFPVRFLQIPIDFNGKHWTLRFRQIDGGFFTLAYIGVWLTLVGGISITLLLFALIRSLLNTRAEAQRIAENLTEELRENRTMLQQILDTVPHAIFWKDKAGVYLGCNLVFPPAVGLVGTEQVIGKTDFDMPWPRKEAEVYREDDAQVVASGIPKRNIVEQMQQVDGARLWISTTKLPLLNAQGEVQGVLGVFEDITNRKRMEDELFASHVNLEKKVLERTRELEKVNAALTAEIQERAKSQIALSESELRYRTLFTRASIGILILSMDGKVIEINELFARMHGYSVEEMLSMNLKDLDTPETFQLAPERFRRILAGDNLTFEVEHYHKDRHIFPLEVSASRVSAGGKSFILCFHLDIIERKQAERDRIAREVAEEASLTKSLFVANMSHEIRTPMNAILGFAQILESDPSLTSEQAEYVRIITHSGAHLLRLIGDILDISKIESGRITLSEATFSLHDLLSDVETMFHSRVSAKGLQLLMERDANTPRYVTGDESRLRQVFVNIIGNASKFTVTGWIAVRVRTDVVVGKTGGDENTLRLVVEVEDTGPGIPDEEMGWIFGSFQQGGAGVKIGGTGLGLAISRRFVEMMRGELTATSQVGKGSCFRFEVLLKPAGEVAVQDKMLPRRIVGLEPASLISPVPISLSVELIQAMRQAVEEGDINQLTELIVEVEKLDSVKASVLHALADQFDYEKLGQWLEKEGTDQLK
jgi:PAS domain S-box-containing protein